MKNKVNEWQEFSLKKDIEKIVSIMSQNQAINYVVIWDISVAVLIDKLLVRDESINLWLFWILSLLCAFPFALLTIRGVISLILKKNREYRRFSVSGLHLRPTYPIRDIEIVSKAIKHILEKPEATSLRSAYPADFAPYKCFTKSRDGYFRCLFEGMTLDEANQPRQGFTQVYIPDGYVDVLKVSFIAASDCLHGERMIAFEVPSRTDVDTPRQMSEVEGYMSRHDHVLYQYLKENYGSSQKVGDRH